MSILELKKLCIKDNIPIIRDDMIPFFEEFIISNNISSILEVGTAYGYSSCCFYNINNNLSITSIEKNLDSHKIAKSFLPKNIKLLNIDAFEFNTSNKYDLIFIDGPKSNQKILLEKYINYLNENGFIIIDNIFLNDIKKKIQTNSRINLIKKNDEFVSFLKTTNEYNVKILDIADGVAIIWKK